MSNRLETLLSRLSSSCRRGLDLSAGAASLAGEPEVTPVRFFRTLLAEAPPALVSAAEQLGWDLGVVARRLDRRLPEPLGRAVPRPQPNRELAQLFAEAWLTASLEVHEDRISIAHLLIALAESPLELRQEFPLAEELRAVYQNRPSAFAESGPASQPLPRTNLPADSEGALTRYTVDLTAAARAGRLDPILGRDQLVRELLDILTRRRQNNPVLVGDAGVGKTAIVEGLAQRIAAGEVPPALAGCAIRSLDLALLQAGASMQGEFEKRLKELLSALQSGSPSILFIDEAHMLMGAGSAQGSLSAANLLKPALARGELRAIAATTYSEYKRYFEKDPALARRFQLVRVEEPSEEDTAWILRGAIPALEQHHGVPIESGAVDAAVRLSVRYLAGRQLPDKAVSLLDSAAARVALSRVTPPPPVARLQADVARLESEMAMAADDGATARLADRLADAETALADLERRLDEERQLADRVRAANDSRQPQRAQLLQEQLRELQGQEPLVHAAVDERAVAEVIAEWTGIPAARMLAGPGVSALTLQSRLAQRIAGQDHALAAIARRLQTAQAGLADPNRPVGVFLLTGPTGCGKSETPRAVAEILHGGDRNLVTISLSEYQEAHSIAGLRGAPPGYIGFGESGALTEAVRRRPYSVVMLDEAEKAHPDVLEFLYELLDQGRIEDAAGRMVDFRHTVIFLTANAAAEQIERLCAGRPLPSPDQLAEAIRPELRRTFKPALLGRVTVIPYYPITHAVLRDIVERKLQSIAERLWRSHGLRLSLAEDAIEWIARQSQDGEGGARSIDRVLADTLLADLSRQLLSASGPRDGTLCVAAGGTGLRYAMRQ
jgi:type VI secretion system protein VasG